MKLQLDIVQCKHIKKDGQRCNGRRMKDSDFCYWHNPKITNEEKKSARSKGGSSTNLTISKNDIKLMQVNSIDDLNRIINICVQQVYSGKITTKQSNSISKLIGNYKDIVETVLLTKKIEILEKKLNSNGDIKELYEYKK